ncbi:MAG: hypothetical protein ACREVC_17330, partial [Burkholderiales bacterium]
VVSFPGRDFDHLNVATHDPYLLDTISAHKIETGYYYPLAEYVLSASDGFAEAVQGGYLSAADLSEFYLPLGNLQKIASEMGNLFHQDATSTAGGFVKLLIGGLGAMVAGDRNEVNQLVDAYIDTRYFAGRYENDAREYVIARDTDWSLRLRIGGAALGIGTVAAGVFGLVFGLAGAIALAPVFKLVESISSDEAEFLRNTFDAGWTGGPLPDSSAEEVLLRSDLVGAALDVSDPRGSGIRLATVADFARDDLENFAQAMLGDADDWYTQTSKYLVDRANETGQQSALGKAEKEFWTYSERAAQTNPILLASVDDQATQFASDWATMLADASPDAAVHGTSPLDVSGLDTYAEKRQFWDGALATLENLLDLFVGTAHAQEYEQQVRREIDDAVAGIQSVAIRQGRPANPFASPDFHPDASISLGALAAGSVRTFTLYLPYDAGSGGQRVELALAGGAANLLALLDHAGEVALGPDGAFTLVVPEGRRELSFGLRAKQDIAGGATLGLSAQLVDAQNVATHSAHLELNLALDGAGAALPVTSREIRGDWEAKPWTDPATGITYAYRLDDLGNVERQTDVPATRAWGPEQFLRGSSGADHMVTGNFVVQAFGDAGDDFILGSDDSGNYLAGGAGSDRIEGGGWADHAAEYLELDLLGRTIGLGDDKIYGGAGDDSIWGEREATQAELDDPGA